MFSAPAATLLVSFAFLFSVPVKITVNRFILLLF
jgi:hypothetical protein